MSARFGQLSRRLTHSASQAQATSLRIPANAAIPVYRRPEIFTTMSRPVSANMRNTESQSRTLVKSITGTLPVPEKDLTAHHVLNEKGERVKFKNPWPSAGEPWEGLQGGLRALRTSWRYGLPPTHAEIPQVKPTFRASADASSPSDPSALRATWLGHACYLAEFPSGLTVLFDPVFEDRCFPVSWAGPKRFTPPPCTLAELPPVDAVVISHSHYDHCSLSSLREIRRAHPGAHFFVGLGLADWMRENVGLGKDQVTEMDWWQDVELTLLPAGKGKGTTSQDGAITATVSCLPSQHTSARTAFDKDTTLWASWSIASAGKSVWFGGDTGYRRVPEVAGHARGEQGRGIEANVDYHGPDFESLPHNPDFAKIGQLRGPFDLGLIPIGAYGPRSTWSAVHADPKDAVAIFMDTRCRRAVGIHWGTWTLTSEDVEEPPRLLREALRRRGVAETGVFDVCAVGESRDF